MNPRAVVLALAMALLLGSGGRAGAQTFNSVSSQPPATQATAEAPRETTPVPAAPAAFSSVSSPAAVAAEPAVPSPAGAAGSSAPPAFSSVSSAADDSGPGGGSGPSLPASGGAARDAAERIVIEKGNRRLLLVNGEDVIATYPVRLGLNPYGHKQREGDFRTPEGTYYLSRRNPNSDFFLSVEVSYPNAEDRERARRAGVRPGGLIMIHGQPNTPRKPPEYYANNDWTDGCIAVSNSDMVDIWLRTRLGIPIEIRP